MLRQGDRVLVQDRSDPDWPGITFPGGHVEPGESLVRSVIREVCEETGLTIEDPALRRETVMEEDGSYRYLVFLPGGALYRGGSAPDEGEVYWLPLSEPSRTAPALRFSEMLPLPPGHPPETITS